jgi:undecaprenyl-diphosphatase
MFESIKSVSLALIITGVVLLLSNLVSKRNENINLKKGLFIGLAQACAIIPGISRSGMTISAALISGVSNKEAAKFSFLLAIPAILGAIIVTALDIRYEFASTIWLPIVITSVTAFISGYYALKILIKLLDSGKFYYFAYYCLLLGLITLIIT